MCVARLTAKTAVGTVTIEEHGKCTKRGDTYVYFGQLDDGRWCVASRWQGETVTRSKDRAERVYHRLMGQGDV